MSGKTRVVEMLVKVRVPVGTKAAGARKEVRWLISDQSTWDLDPGDIRLVSVKPAPRRRGRD